MDLNVLLRGQSNAFLLGLFNGPAITAQTQSLLGFDGVNDRVVLQYAYENPAASTVYSGTALLTDWLTPTANGGWQVGPLEQGILNYVNALPPSDKAEPTAVVWLHSEYDSINPGLQPATWEGAVRYDAALIRQAYGKAAADLPYLFVSAVPYGGGTDAGHQAIRLGMETLAADAAFNAGIAARAQDVNMDWDLAGQFGGSHLSFTDQQVLAGRIARSLAEEFAGFAKPGSPVALAGGNIDNLGPKVVQATVSYVNQLMLKVAFDAAGSLAPLDAVAARGEGWTIIAPDGRAIEGGAAAINAAAPDTLYVSFEGAIPAGGRLYYGYGYGRTAGPDGTGQGHAVYDNAGLPVWVQADGLPIGGAAVAVTAEASASVTQVGPAGGSYAATAASETWVLQANSGMAVIEGFAPGQDRLQFQAIPADSAIYWDPGFLGVQGLGITWAGAQGGVVLPGIASLADRDILFA